MLDLRRVLDEMPHVEAQLARRGPGATETLAPLKALGERRRALIMDTESARHAQKQGSERMREAQKQGPEVAAALRAELKAVSERIKRGEVELAGIEKELSDALLAIPNLPHVSVPGGTRPEDNPQLALWGQKPEIAHPKWHDELGAALNILDTDAGARVAGARFAFLKGAGARLSRALIQFMLDLHANRGYTEIVPPYLVNAASMRGTGQLPKFEADLFKTTTEPPLYLIPTAEVPVTNYHAGQIIEQRLPLKYCAYSPCFRAEAGSYGKDVRGLIRQHQFEKVELVKFARPEESYAELESLLDDACEVLRRLELHHRVVALCAGDLGFAAAKTYDIEVWLPGQGAYREISSCSNFEDYQARRAGIRFRPAPGEKPRLAHTLNGSGLAVGRTLVAILEQNQEPDGSVRIPGALQPYMGGLERIVP